MDSKYTIRLEPKDFANESDMGHGRRGVKNDLEDFGLSKERVEEPFTEMGKTQRRLGREMRVQLTLNFRRLNI